MTQLTLRVLPQAYVICRLDGQDSIPEWAGGDLVAITRTNDELSIVCAEGKAPPEIRQEPGWRCLQVAGPLDFSQVGVLASLTNCLARANVSVFAISTFDTDYLLIKRHDLDIAIESLTRSGNTICVDE